MVQQEWDFLRGELEISDQTYQLLIGIAVVLAVVAILAIFIPWLRDFRRELRYLNMEIRRNRGRERAYWERRKRRLWLSIIPFVRYR